MSDKKQGESKSSLSRTQSVSTMLKAIEPTPGLPPGPLADENVALKQKILRLEQELSEVRATMMHRMQVEQRRKRANRQFINLVNKASTDGRASRIEDEHELSRRKREAAVNARREAAHARLAKRRSLIAERKKTKKASKQKIAPDSPSMSHGVGTDACDVKDFVVTMTHGPLGLHLEEIHDCTFGTFVADTVEGSQAREQGLQMGDMLTSVSGETMEDVSFDDVIQILMASARPMQLGFRRRMRVYCDHAHGSDGLGHMHGAIFSVDITDKDMGFEFDEQTNSTLSGVRYDCHVSDQGIVPEKMGELGLLY